MRREDLVRACQPLSPEEALDGLCNLYAYMANSVGTEAKDLEAVNAGIEVLRKCIKEGG